MKVGLKGNLALQCSRSNRIYDFFFPIRVFIHMLISNEGIYRYCIVLADCIVLQAHTDFRDGVRNTFLEVYFLPWSCIFKWFAGELEQSKQRGNLCSQLE